MIAAVDRGEPSERRWYVRLEGEEKDFITVWFVLGQRTLQYETYVTPAPEENHAAFYEHLLRRNAKLNGVAFSIGVEDAVYLRGQIGVRHIDERRARPHPRIALRVQRAVLSPCHANWVRIEVSGLIRGDFSISH